MYGCESWAIKKPECQRTDASELWHWRRLLRVLRTARRSNQSILKEINLEYSLGGLMLRQKPQYFGHLMWRANSLEKTLMLGKTEGRRRRGQHAWMVGWHRWLNGHQFEQTPGACSNSCPLSQRCHPTISFSVVPFSFCLQSCPASGSFPMSQLFTSSNQNITSGSVLQVSIQDWSPCYPGDSQGSSPTPQFKSISFSVLCLLYWLSSSHSCTRLLERP